MPIPIWNLGFGACFIGQRSLDSIIHYLTIMIRVIQVIMKEVLIEKPFYTPDARRAFWEWPSPGFVSGLRLEGDRLLISKLYPLPLNHPDQLVFSEFTHPGEAQYAAEVYHTGHSFDIFRTESKGEIVRFFTNFSHIRYSEIPWPDNHKIAELRPGETFRYMGNDRLDYTMSARKQRRYRLYDYLVHYMGRVTSIEHSVALSKEPVPITDWRTVDERKILN